MNEKKSRVEWIDILRGFAILLVILGHNNPPFMAYIYGFHMPLFFILSGYLFDEKLSLKEHFKRIINRYVLSYFLLCFLNLIIYYIEVMIVNGTLQLTLATIISNIKDIIIVFEPGMQGCFQLWFLPALAIALSVFTLCMQIKVRALRWASVLFMSGFGFWLGYHNIKMPFRFSIAFVAVLFVGFGYLLKKYEALKVFDNIDSIVLKILIIVGFIAAGYFAIDRNMINGPIDMSDAIYRNQALFIIGATTWVSVLIILFSRIKGHNLVENTLGVFGRHTIFFLAFDESSNLMGGVFLEKFKFPHMWYTDFLTHLIVLFIYYLICRFIYKMIKSAPGLV